MLHVRRVRNKIIDLSKVDKRIQGAWAIPRQEIDLNRCKFEGVYILTTDKGDVLYIGRANNIADRLSSHLEYRTNSSVFMDYVHAVIIVKGDPEIEYDIIDTFRPIFNSRKSNNRGVITVAGDTVAFIRKHVICEHPSKRDLIIKALIARNRITNESVITDINKYSGGVSDEDVLQALEIIVNEDIEKKGAII